MHAHHGKMAFRSRQIRSATTRRSVNLPRSCSTTLTVIPSGRPPGGFPGRIAEHLAAGIVCGQLPSCAVPSAEKWRAPNAFGSRDANDEEDEFLRADSVFTMASGYE